MRVEREIEIERPPEEVFGFLADSQNMPRWRAELDEVKQITGGPPGKGTTYSFIRSRRPPLESTVEWVEFEPNRRLTWQGAKAKIGPGWLQFSGTHNLMPRSSATHLRSVFETKFGGGLRPLELLLRGMVRRELDRSFQTLKQVLESEPRAADGDPSPPS